MAGQILLYSGAGIIFIWGVAHLIPTKSVVAGFGELSKDNRSIITMEWIAEGLTLCFISVLVFFTALVGEAGSVSSGVVYITSAVMLLILAVLSFFTSARTAIIPMKICPWVKLLTAGLILLGMYS